MKQRPVIKVILHGREDEMFDMLRAFHVAQRDFPGGKGASGGILGLRMSGVFYSIKWNRASVSIWVSK